MTAHIIIVTLERKRAMRGAVPARTLSADVLQVAVQPMEVA